MSQPLNRLESLRTLRNANLDGAFANAFMTLCGGAILVGYVKHLGGSDQWIGLLTAIPSLFGLLQIPGSIWGRSFPSFKRFVTPGGWGLRLFYAPFAILPLLAFSADLKLLTLVACVMLSSACLMVVGPIYNDWLAELVPVASRGWFFSRRNAILAAVGTGSGLAGGLILDGMKAGHRPNQGFAIVFGLGFVLAVVSMIFYLRMTDIPRPNPVKQSLKEGVQAFAKPICDRRFRMVLVFMAIFVFGQTFPGNLFGAYALESLKLPFTLIQACGAFQALGTIVFGALWGYMADKYGNRPLLLLSGIGIAFTATPWILTRPNDLAWNATVLLIGHIYSGAVWGGVSVCQFNIILATADPRDRAPYLGVGMALQAVIGGIAPLIGAQTMAFAREPLGVWGAYHLIFWTTMGLRILGILFLIPVREPGSAGIRDTLKKLRSVTPGGYVALRSLNRSAKPEDRRQAIGDVASRGFAVAAEEIIEALHDPAPRVRREAAMALGRLEESRAAQALIHQLLEHPDLVEDETIDSLGDLRSAEAVAPLIEYLRSPRSSLRRAAAKALGRIGSQEAAPALIAAVQDPHDPDLRRAALQALRLLESCEAEPAIVDALMDPWPSVRIAAAEAVAELCIESAAPRLRQSLGAYDDEAGSEAAYALGAVGTVDDIPQILTEAKACRSVITRRRALLGVARILAVEHQVYRLFMSSDLARDAALMELAGPVIRKNARVRLAVEKYSSGDECEALRTLAHAKLGEVFEHFTDPCVDEAFLVALAAAGKMN